MAEYELKALCDDTGVSPRTVYFYVQQGLLPPAEGAGRGARYTDVHRDRLRLIKQLQDQHLPLAEIRKQLESLSDRDLSRLASGGDARRLRSTSAAEYIRSVLSGPARLPMQAQQVQAQRVHASMVEPSALRLDATPPERSQWERIVLAPEIELHVRRPLSRVMNRKLEKLLEHARAVLKEQT